jgi:peptide/nickel transport system substrate-binding protein
MAHRADEMTSAPAGRAAVTRRKALQMGLLAGLGAAVVDRRAEADEGSPAPVRAQAAGAVKRLTVADTMFLQSADPARAYELFQYIPFRACYDPLVTVPPNTIDRIVPALAAAWSVAPDATGLTFKLRPNVKFSTGNALTSADVRWSLLRVRNVNGSPAWFVDPIKSIETPDALTVKINLKSPDVTYLAVLISTNLSILDSQFLRGKGGTTTATDTADGWLNSNSAGTGPYVMTEWSRNNQMTLKRFPGSWRPGWFDEVVCKAVPEAATGKLLLERGDVDVVLNLVPEQFESLKGNPKVKVVETLFAGFPYIGMTRLPEVHEALPKPRVGVAVRYAIDYAGIRSLVPGSGSPASIVPLGHFGALDPKEGVKTDLRRAKELLTAAGYPNGFEVVLSHHNRTLAGTVTANVLAEKVQADLAQIGIRVRLEPLEPAVLAQRYSGQKTQMVISAYVGDYPDASNWLRLYNPGGVIAKRVGWSDMNYESVRLTDEAVRTVDAAKRKDLYERAQRLFIQDSPYVPLLQGVQRIAYRANLRGVVSNAMWWTDVSLMSQA